MLQVKVTGERERERAKGIVETNLLMLFKNHTKPINKIFV
jgi:hypothetical protein